MSYLLGSLMGGLIVGRLRGGVDLRSAGSGNVGGTNALRTHGKAFAFWVVLIDVTKGVVAAAVIPQLLMPGIGFDPAVDRAWLVAACAAAAVFGHVYPVWHEFRGGKGAATLVGALLGMQPILLLPVLLVWLAVVALSGYVGLATMCASVALPVYVCATQSPLPLALAAFSVVMAVFVIYTHRSNIARMLRHAEPRAGRLWLLRR
ncbi:MAG TPA: glycerol-3-phosphate 1-O-acyltransferase PlsY [Steroidobacteraceae bacterium]|nr:glycerol-3-phosphate 1-O-acyltransferase PlsY [Steroidobacteraceae bacterium]